MNANEVIYVCRQPFVVAGCVANCSETQLLLHECSFVAHDGAGIEYEIDPQTCILRDAGDGNFLKASSWMWLAGNRLLVLK